MAPIRNTVDGLHWSSDTETGMTIIRDTINSCTGLPTLAVLWTAVENNVADLYWSGNTGSGIAVI